MATIILNKFGWNIDKATDAYLASLKRGKIKRPKLDMKQFERFFNQYKGIYSIQTERRMGKGEIDYESDSLLLGDIIVTSISALFFLVRFQ